MSSASLQTPPGAAASLTTYALRYAKKDQARYYGQLEVSRILERAVRRSGLPVAFSRGFHPHAKISFREALPVGMESEAEEAEIQLEEAVAEQTILKRLNDQLPDGFRILSVKRVEPTEPRPSRVRVTYLVSGLTEKTAEAIMAHYPSAADRIVRKKTKKGCIEARCADVLVSVRRIDATRVAMDLVEGPTARFRPQSIFEVLFPDTPEVFTACRLCKVSVAPFEE